MRYRLLFFYILFVVLFPACSGKQYFNPLVTYPVSTSSYSGKIIDLTRDGATLNNHAYIGKNGINYTIQLSNGYRFLSENSQYRLSSNPEGVLNVIDKRTRKSVRAVALHLPVVSASISHGLIAYILNNNTFGLYRISDNKKIFENRSERTFAIDTRSASPMFIDNLVVMPMLDGKLIIVDIHNSENTKVIYLSSSKVFNNIIYLSRIADTLVAATPHKIITIGSNGKYDYSANISEVTVTHDSIYLFTKEGNILKLDTSLTLQVSKKFKFAHFAVATAFQGKVYALDQQGSLIVLSSDLKRSKVYALGAVKRPAFITGSKLYKDGQIIDLSKLGYE